MLNSRSILRATVLWLATQVAVAQGERPLDIVGSSTMYPLAQQVATQFDTNGAPAPQLRSTGTGNGFKLFCAGTGSDTPDIALASRPISAAEQALCTRNGVNSILEIRVGYDAVALSSVAWPPSTDLSRQTLFLALAAQVPAAQGDTLIANPYQSWHDIDPTLPDQSIKIVAPDSAHGTYDFFIEHVMLTGCEQVAATHPALKDLQEHDPKSFKAVCTTFRQDGRFVTLTLDDYSVIAATLEKEPQAIGILGALFALRNHMKTLSIDSMDLSLGAISHQSYPITRPLLLYVKQDHLAALPALGRYIDEFTSERAWGTTVGAYLFHQMLMVPMPLQERKAMRDIANVALQH